jgi:predicted ester cyclase
MEPTGRRVTSSGISIDRVQDGKIVESWIHWDNAGMMQQLGLMEGATAAAG